MLTEALCIKECCVTDNISVCLCVLYDDHLWLQAVILIVLLGDGLNSPGISKRPRWSLLSLHVTIRDDFLSSTFSFSYLNLRKIKFYLRRLFQSWKWFNHTKRPICCNLRMKSRQRGCVSTNWTMFRDSKRTLLQTHPSILSRCLFLSFFLFAKC